MTITTIEIIRRNGAETSNPPISTPLVITVELEPGVVSGGGREIRKSNCTGCSYAVLQH